MRWASKLPALLLAAASAVALWPAVAQRAPESILPPGFGQPEPVEKASPAPPARDAARPVDAPDPVPDVELRAPDVSDGGNPGDVLVAEASNNQLAAVTAPIDLPPQARRSLDRVGLLAQEDGGFSEAAFGTSDGGFLSSLMARTDAPIASRWVSIVLRRALLSPTSIPGGIDGADWVAERAWLLLRMGEADMARALVARVDADNFTPKLYAVAMQAALATGDPAALCPIADAAEAVSDEASWPLARAMCAGLAGEAGTASALADRVRDSGRARGIDVLLAEKVIGAGTNTRRSVSVQWDGVDRLSAWRFGLATATGVTVPDALFGSVGRQVRAWNARAPLIVPSARLSSAERATSLGVFSSAALVDAVAAVWDATDVDDRAGTPGELLRVAYAGNGSAARLSAMRSLWDAGKGTDPYARLILTARAAAAFPQAGGASESDAERLIAAMLAAGLDIQASRWDAAVTRGSYGWALLALGAPRAPSGIDASTVAGVPGGTDDMRVKFLIAGLAGLGRLPLDQASNLAQRFDAPLGMIDSWTRAIDAAAARGDAGTVVLLAAAGMQTREWRYVPPSNLYHIVAALRQVGLEPEARMIAAEALTRS